MDELSNSNMGEFQLSIMHSTWVNSSSNPMWMNSQIQTWVNLNSQLFTLKFNMGELKFKSHVDEL
jgi:hypothetical protein